MNKTDQKYNCEVIQDLLPLYRDCVCSSSSRQMVEEHLEECADCRRIADRLQDTRLDSQLVKEKNGVLSAHAKKEQKKTVLIGMITAGVLLIPVLVCLICNLAIGHALDWFFIVLTSLLIVASLTVVPLTVPQNAGMWAILSATGSLILLILTVCIYSGGDWFFLVTIPTVFGLSVVFLPYVIYRLPLPEALARCKGLLTMLWDTIWLYATIVICGIHSADPEYWQVAIPITSICVLIPWVIFLMVRYTSMHPLSKAGCILWVLGIFGAFGNDLFMLLAFRKWDIRISHANLLTWEAAWEDNLTGEFYWNVADANVSLIVLIVCLVIGAVLFAAGCRNRKK
ncbi:MAG: zf-HC2 domain-containing protein [Lachnospiraceae bacterium]|nr:zf-HC2 domain-containing protein [Lachnospiraceae bacterium]